MKKEGKVKFINYKETNRVNVNVNVHCKQTNKQIDKQAAGNRSTRMDAVFRPQTSNGQMCM